jgi:hypothetical protein
VGSRTGKFTGIPWRGRSGRRQERKNKNKCARIIDYHRGRVIVMSRLIATIISGLSRPHFPFIVLESSLVQSCLPVLRAFVNDRDATSHVLIFCLLYPPSAFADETSPRGGGLHVIDRTAQVPGYSETSSPDLAESILNGVKQGAAHYNRSYCERNETAPS